MKTINRMFCLAAFFGVLGQSAPAQDWPEWLKTKQLFRVKVTGQSPAGTGRNSKGTAFAIGPNTLITARHVPGERTLYRNQITDGTAYVPQRVVKVFFAKSDQASDGEGVDDEVTVTPAAFETVDATRLNFLNLNATPFPLSACDIDREETYTILKMRDHEVSKPVTVAIKKRRFGFSDFGDVTVFQEEGISGEAIIDGDSGSPVLNKDGQVVGLVSAVRANEIFVTLTNSFLGLVPQDIAVECSGRDLDEKLDALTDVVAGLNTKSEALEDRIAALEGALDSLRVELKLTNQTAEAAMRSLEDLGDVEVLDQEKIAAILEAVSKGKPLKPTVQRISQDLGFLEWSFNGNLSRDKARLNIAYNRQLSGQAYSTNLHFCLTPMITPSGDVVSSRNPKLVDFYQVKDSEILDDDSKIGLCLGATHRSSDPPGKVKNGAYSVEYPQFIIQAHAQQDTSGTWPGFYYLQVVRQTAEQDDNGDDVLKREIIRRSVVDLVADEGVMPCQTFQNAKNVADFMHAESFELPVDETC